MTKTGHFPKRRVWKDDGGKCRKWLSKFTPTAHLRQTHFFLTWSVPESCALLCTQYFSCISTANTWSQARHWNSFMMPLCLCMCVCVSVSGQRVLMKLGMKIIPAQTISSLYFRISCQYESIAKIWGGICNGTTYCKTRNVVYLNIFETYLQSVFPLLVGYKTWGGRAKLAFVLMAAPTGCMHLTYAINIGCLCTHCRCVHNCRLDDAAKIWGYGFLSKVIRILLGNYEQKLTTKLCS